MDIVRVTGSVVATAKTPGLSGRALLLVQPIDGSGEPTNVPPYVAVDRVGAGLDEVVLVARHRAARLAVDADVEVDAAIVAIVDAVDMAGRATYRKA